MPAPGWKHQNPGLPQPAEYAQAAAFARARPTLATATLSAPEGSRPACRSLRVSDDFSGAIYRITCEE
jgi:hypothetical protein